MSNIKRFKCVVLFTKKKQLVFLFYAWSMNITSITSHIFSFLHLSFRIFSSTCLYSWTSCIHFWNTVSFVSIHRAWQRLSIGEKRRSRAWSREAVNPRKFSADNAPILTICRSIVKSPAATSPRSAKVRRVKLPATFDFSASVGVSHGILVSGACICVCM